MLASSWGSYLDQIAATYYGISRLVVGTDEETGDPIMEADQTFKNRIVLAPEAFSTAGPEGAYVFHALELDGTGDVADAAAYSEEDGAVYANNDPVLAPEILVVILPRLAYAGSGPALIDRVYAAVTAENVRPLGDKVTVELADDHEYEVEATIRIAPGADPQPVAAEARKQVEAYVAARRRIGTIVQRLGLGGALRVTDVTEIELTAPAADIDRGSKGAATCTGITITVEEGADTWRAIP
jgi:phage-related baseplate assembly protein